MQCGFWHQPENTPKMKTKPSFVQEVKEAPVQWLQRWTAPEPSWRPQAPWYRDYCCFCFSELSKQPGHPCLPTHQITQVIRTGNIVSGINPLQLTCRALLVLPKKCVLHWQTALTATAWLLLISPDNLCVHDHITCMKVVSRNWTCKHLI